MANYFNTLNLREQLDQLGRCRFMAREEFATEADYLKGKKVVIVGCGAQGLNQGLNMRDSGLDVLTLCVRLRLMNSVSHLRMPRIMASTWVVMNNSSQPQIW